MDLWKSEISSQNEKKVWRFWKLETINVHQIALYVWSGKTIFLAATKNNESAFPKYFSPNSEGRQQNCVDKRSISVYSQWIHQQHVTVLTSVESLLPFWIGKYLTG